MSNIDIFELLGKMRIDGAEEANAQVDGVTDNARDSSTSIADSFKKVGTAIATYFAVDKIIGFGKGCAESAATVQAKNAQFASTFGDLQGAASKMFESVGNQTGILATRLQTEGTSAFSMFKGAGMDANTALEETETFMSHAADAAAYYDISLEEASERVRGFAKGKKIAV